MFKLYKAEVVSPGKPEDPRLTVRIVPHMVDISDESVLPKFPPFLKNHIPNFPVKTILWVISDEQFLVGYILGPTNVFSEFPDNYLNLKKQMYTMNQVSLSAGSGFHSYEDLYITYVDSNLIEAVDLQDGTRLIYHSSGSFYSQGPRGIYIKYGVSTIEILPESISLKSKTITLSALENIVLSSEKGNKEGAGGKFVVTTSNPGDFILPNGGAASANPGVRT